MAGACAVCESRPVGPRAAAGRGKVARRAFLLSGVDAAERRRSRMQCAKCCKIGKKERFDRYPVEKTEKQPPFQILHLLTHLTRRAETQRSARPRLVDHIATPPPSPANCASPPAGCDTRYRARRTSPCRA
jgi:hypothetical protein